jgi:hypothetical protein
LETLSGITKSRAGRTRLLDIEVPAVIDSDTKAVVQRINAGLNREFFGAPALFEEMESEINAAPKTEGQERIGRSTQSIITVHGCRFACEACSEGEVINPIAFPRTRIEAAHDVMAVSGERRLPIVLFFHD